MTLHIRAIEQRDEPDLARMIRDVFDEHEAPRQGTVYSDPTTDHLYDFFERPGSICWVAILQGKAVGCCGIYPTQGLPKGCAELVKFYLSKDARGKGIGSQLMRRSIESARQLGYKLLYLESLPHFDRAIDMYKRSGFRTLEHPMGNSGHTSCNIWMIKDL